MIRNSIVFANNTFKSLLLLCCIAVISNCSSFKRVEFILPDQDKKIESWDAVFKNPRPIKIETFVSGKAITPISYIYDLNHPKMENAADSQIEVPVLMHLVIHEKFGSFLIDAGLDSTFQKNEYGSAKGILVKRMMGKFSQNKGENISYILQKRSVYPKAIFFTHLHPDHILGAAELSSHMQYVIGRSEKHIYYPPLFYSKCFSHIDTVHEITFKNSNHIAPFTKCVDIFGDGSFWAISSEGHTKGHVSYLINGNGKPVIVCGDACNSLFALKNQIAPGTKHSKNPENAQKCVNTFAKFNKMYPQVKFLYGHDLPNSLERDSINTI